MIRQTSFGAAAILVLAAGCSDDDSDILNESNGGSAGSASTARPNSGASGKTWTGGAAGKSSVAGASGLVASLGGSAQAGQPLSSVTAEAGVGGLNAQSGAASTSTPLGNGGTTGSESPSEPSAGSPNSLTSSAGGNLPVNHAGAAGFTASVCGNNRCDAGETPDSCCSDCGCSSEGAVCHRGSCTTPVAISAGGYHTCVLRSDGLVECWGGNNFGELGNGGISTAVVSSTVVPGLTRAKAIAAGTTFTCALVEGGGVRCWGGNASGQLGDGSQNPSTSPVSVTNINDATSVAAGFDSACAVLSDETIKCWGNNHTGQLGDGTTTDSAVPVAVAGISGAKSVAVGYGFACAIRSDGTGRCWGGNASGQLGNGNTTNTLAPVTVSPLAGATAVTAACDEIQNSIFESDEEGSACALMADGTVRCWGANGQGELGKGNMSTSVPRPVPVLTLANSTGVSAGYRFACAVDQSGSIRCWGFNAQGQLGNGSTGNSSVPTLVSSLSNAKQVVTGSWHACALLRSGTVKCWGSNARRELGNVDSEASSIPLAVPTWVGVDHPTPGGGGNAGGASSIGAGGTTANGGTLATGGVIVTGGAPVTGGTTATGGTMATGGTATTGGAMTSGGTENSAGAPTTGYEAGSSGTPAAAGASATGGATESGGTAATGGTTSAPECTTGATQCDGRHAMRTCVNGSWVGSSCGSFQACAASMCRDACDGLVIPNDSVAACHVPVDPYNTRGLYHGAPLTAITISTDTNAVPAWVSSGVAYDTHDTSPYTDDTYSSVIDDPLGLIWTSDYTSRTVGRLYLSGYLDMALYTTKFGAKPSSITLHVKMRRIDDASRVAPWPGFALFNEKSEYITYWTDESAILTPTTEWAIYEREFSQSEIDRLTSNSDSNWYELDFGGDSSRSLSPQVVQVAWFAVTYGSPR